MRFGPELSMRMASLSTSCPGLLHHTERASVQYERPTEAGIPKRPSGTLICGEADFRLPKTRIAFGDLSSLKPPTTN